MLIESPYPRVRGGRPVYPMAMLRIHLMQSWFGYNDPAVKEALYETTILCQFSGLSLECIFDKTTILRPLTSDTKRNAVNDHDEKSPGLTGAI